MALTPEVYARAGELQKLGLKPADAVHVAAAESLNCDVLLSCDDRLCRVSGRNCSRLRVIVANPVIWVKENVDASDA